jgi:hypothetical protein
MKSLLRAVELFSCLALLLISAGGCSSDKFEEEPVKAQLRQIGKAYWMIADFKKRPPQDVEELKAGLKDLHALDLAGPPDEVLVSPRDNQPFVIIYGGDPAKEESTTILAYEQQGADNSRWALTMNGEIVQLSHDDFAKAKFNNQHKPLSGA